VLEQLHLSQPLFHHSSPAEALGILLEAAGALAESRLDRSHDQTGPNEGWTGPVFNAGSESVAPANHPPVAVDDSYAGNEDTPITIGTPGVLANDTDADGNALTAAIQSGPAHGTLALNANGSFTYTPDANWDGADSFTYRVADGHGGTATGTVNLTVAAV